MSITKNIIKRTFHLSFAESEGTCFTIDYDNRQYIVTARHIVESITDSATIRIKHEQVWKDYPVNLVGHGDGEIDISVLAASIQISPTCLLPPRTDGLAWAQDVYFLGFLALDPPYDWVREFGEFNDNFPMPLIKKAIISYSDPNASCFLLDGHGNRGFSGGPVVFSEVGKSGAQLSVAAVIAKYLDGQERVTLEDGMSFKIKYNSGVIVAYGIKHAIDLISQNPIGFMVNDINM